MSPAPGIAPDRRTSDIRNPIDRDAGRDELPANMARQGVTGHNVRFVLLIGIAAVVVAFLVAFLFVVGRPG